MKNRNVLLLIFFLHLAVYCHGQGWVMEYSMYSGSYSSCGLNNYEFQAGSFTVRGRGGDANDSFFVKGTGTFTSVSAGMELMCPASTSFSGNANTSGKIDWNSLSCSGVPDGLITMGLGANRWELAYYFHAQLRINTPSVFCNAVTLTSPVCAFKSRGYVWEVTGTPSVASSWKTVNKTTSTISITSDELLALGLTDVYNAIYVRVSDKDLAGRTSIVNFFTLDAPPPTVSITGQTEVRCHGEANGSVTLQIANPVVNQFRINGINLDNPAYQIDIQDGVYNGSFVIGGLAAGNWEFQVINKNAAGECNTIINHIVTEPTPVMISFNTPLHNGYAIKCNGGATGETTAIGFGGKGGYKNYSWNTTATTSTITGLAKGTYTVTLQDVNDCPATTSVVLDEPPPVTVSLTASTDYNDFPVSCWNKNDGGISSSPGGGVPGAYSYVWSTRATTSSITDLGVNTYSIVVKDANGCPASSSLTLTAPDAIDFDIGVIATLKCKGDQTASFQVQNVKDTIGTISYSWSTGETSTSISGKSAGSYFLTVSDGQGCSTKKSWTLADPPAYTVTIEPQSNFNGSVIRCNGESNGALKAVVLNGSGNIAAAQHYTWVKNNTFYDEDESMSSISNLSKGSYSVEITYNTHCKTQSPLFPLKDPEPVSVAVSPSSNHHGYVISCPGASDGSLHAVASKGTGSSYTFLWDTGIPGQDITGKRAGTYTVTAKDVNGCPGTGSGTLIDPPPINPSISVAETYNGLHLKCHNGTEGKLRATTTGGAGIIQYLWSTNDTGQDLINVGAGSYTVTAMDANGCSETSSPKLVINPDRVSASISITSNHHGQPISCFDASDGSLNASASGGTNSFNYSWSTGTTGADLSAIPYGTYILTATDMNNCADTDTITLVNPDPVKAIIHDFSNYNGYGVHCKGDREGFIEAKGEGGTGIYTFFWPGIAETSSKASDLPAGTYTVQVTDNNGCADTEQYVITEPGLLTLMLASAKNISCFDGRDGELAVSAMGGTSGYEYSINAGDWQSDPQFTGLQATIDYSITIRDVNGCQASITETLTQPDELDISFTTEPAFCADPRGAATAEVAGGVGAYTYEWRNATNVIIGTTTEIQNKPAGVYTLLIHDSNHCPLTESIGIISTDGPQVTIAEVIAAKCSYSSDGSGLLKVTDGDGPFEFLWPGGQTTAGGFNLAKGIYHVTITDRNDCVTVTPVEIPAPGELDISIVETALPFCYGECNGKIKVISEGGSGAYIYAWSSQTGEEAVNLCAGNHTVTVTDAHNCTLTETFQLGQPEILQMHLVARTLPLCHGSCNGSIVVEATGGNNGYQFAWNSGSNTALADDICSGDHIVRLSDSKGCTLERTISLGDPAQLEVRLLRNLAPICHDGCNGELEVEAFGGTGSYHYSWDTGAITSRLEGLCAESYGVTIYDDNACSISGIYSIENPPALSIDLGGSVTLCIGQTHILDAGTSWTTYTWTSTTGFTANTSSVTIEDAGQYQVELTNSDGCMAQDTFLLQTSADLLKANMILATEAMAGDTVVIIDVSWPLPENIVWEYPAAMRMITDLDEIIYGQFNDPGLYEIKLTAHLGDCFDEMKKTISILRNEEEQDGGRLGHEEFVKEFTLYPNPNDGSFDVGIELAEESQITLNVWNTVNSLRIGELTDSGKKQYLKHIDLRPLSSGTYLLRLDHAKGYKTIRFIVH